MDYRRYSRWAELGLAALVVAMHATIYFWPENPSRPNFVLMAAHDGQLLAAIGLIVGWIVMGPGRLWVRLIASPALVGLWFWPVNWQMQPRSTPATFVVTVFGCSMVAYLALRAVGFKVFREPVASVPERGSQFSLFGMLLATTAIAIVIGILEALRPTLSSTGRGPLGDFDDFLSFTLRVDERRQQIREIVLAASVALAAVGGLWLVLRPGAIWLRLAALVVLLPTLSVYLTHLSGVGSGTFRVTAESLAIAFATVAGLSAVTVIPLRLVGFRLQRASKLAMAAAARSSSRWQWGKRIAAAITLFGAVAATITWSQVTSPSREDPGRLNLNSWAFVSSVDSIQSPMNGFGDWIYLGSQFSIDVSGSTYLYFGTTGSIGVRSLNPWNPNRSAASEIPENEVGDEF